MWRLVDQVGMGRPYKIYRLLIYNLTLTKLYEIGLKPILGGSIPSFLILLLHRLVPRMCDMVEGSHEVILNLLKHTILILLLVLKQRPLKL